MNLENSQDLRVILSNGLRGRMLGIEDEPVGDRDGGYLADEDEYVLCAVAVAPA
jgi:hypothetical protein